jgi:hypothetical protein
MQSLIRLFYINCRLHRGISDKMRCSGMGRAAPTHGPLQASSSHDSGKRHTLSNIYNHMLGDFGFKWLRVSGRLEHWTVLARWGPGIGEGVAPRQSSPLAAFVTRYPHVEVHLGESTSAGFVPVPLSPAGAHFPVVPSNR